MRLLPTALTVFALALAAGAAASEPKPTLADLPAQVRELLTRQQGEVGDPDAPFSQWCVRQPGTVHVRLVAIEMAPERILVRLQRGGIAGPQPLLAEFTLRDGEWTGDAVPPAQPAQLRWPISLRRFGGPTSIETSPSTWPLNRNFLSSKNEQ